LSFCWYVCFHDEFLCVFSHSEHTLRDSIRASKYTTHAFFHLCYILRCLQYCWINSKVGNSMLYHGKCNLGVRKSEIFFINSL
jgi:hypothetical protein